LIMIILVILTLLASRFCIGYLIFHQVHPWHHIFIGLILLLPVLVDRL
jgi:hypothetical protein